MIRSKFGVAGLLVICVAALVALATVGGGGGSPHDRSSGSSDGGTQIDVTPIDHDVTSSSGRGSDGFVGADATSESRAGASTADAVAPESSAKLQSEPIAASPGSLPTVDPKIIRTGSISLRVPRGKFERVWGDVNDVAGAVGGTIQSASRSSGSRSGSKVGVITLSIPSAKFDDAVEQVRTVEGLKVTRLDVSSQDVSEEYVDVQSRLRHDRAVEGRLLALLAQTKGVGEVLSVQTRLDSVQEQIELETGRLNYLAHQTANSTLSISLREPGTAAKRHVANEPSTIGTAFSDAGERFTGNVASVITWTGGALPALIGLALLALLARVAVRRRTVRAARPSAD